MGKPFGLLQVFQEKNGPRRLYLNDYLVQNTYDVIAKKSFSIFERRLCHEDAETYARRLANKSPCAIIRITPTRIVSFDYAKE